MGIKTLDLELRVWTWTNLEAWCAVGEKPEYYQYSRDFRVPVVCPTGLAELVQIPRGVDRIRLHMTNDFVRGATRLKRLRSDTHDIRTGGKKLSTHVRLDALMTAAGLEPGVSGSFWVTYEVTE